MKILKKGSQVWVRGIQVVDGQAVDIFTPAVLLENWIPRHSKVLVKLKEFNNKSDVVMKVHSRFIHSL